MPDRLLKVPEIADRLGVCRWTVYQRIREGRFPVRVIREFGGMRVSERALDEWIGSAGEVPQGPEPRVSEPRRRRVRSAPSGDVIVPFPE